jgi:peroxiredoxin
MTQFESAYQEFTKRNAGVVFIAGQKIDGLFKGKEHVHKHKYPFPILFDEKRDVTRTYGVYQAVGIDTINLARRSLFVVGGEGKICSIAVSPHQREAPRLQDVLDAIESCAKGRLS